MYRRPDRSRPATPPGERRPRRPRPSAGRTRAANPSLLPVALDGALGTEGGRVGAPTGTAQGPPLAEQVPHLVQGDLDGLQSRRLLVGKTLSDVPLLEALLLVGQAPDPGDDLVVFHRCLLAQRALGPGRQIGRA